MERKLPLLIAFFSVFFFFLLLSCELYYKNPSKRQLNVQLTPVHSCAYPCVLEYFAATGDISWVI